MENNELMVTEEETMEVYDLEPEEEEGGSILGKVLLVAVGVGAGVGITKLRKLAADKTKAKMLKKLEAEGYVITKQEKESEEVDEESEEETKEK